MSTRLLSGVRLARMHDMMARHVERGDVPGVVTLVSRHGDTHVDVIGTKTAGGSDPRERDTIFRISSMTKPITAVGALLLVEECKLRLDERVDDLLPELADRCVLKRLDGPLDDTLPAKRPITLRDLLTSCMGFGQLMALPDVYPILQVAHAQQLGMGPPSPRAMPAPDEWMRRLGSLPLMAQPGERWLYNTASDVLGVLIRRASGQPFETFLYERIFEPLGMYDTSFSVPTTKRTRLLPSYTRNASTGALERYDGLEDSQWSEPPAFASGAGGLVSTIDDYFAFGQMLLHNGTHEHIRILSQESVEAMTSDQLRGSQRAGAEPFLSADRSWGWGVSVGRRHDSEAAVSGRFGWEGGLGTSWASDSKEGLVALLMTQCMGFPGGIYDDFWSAAYQA